MSCVLSDWVIMQTASTGVPLHVLSAFTEVEYSVRCLWFWTTVETSRMATLLRKI